MGTSYKTLETERSPEECFTLDQTEEQRKAKQKFTNCEVNEAFIPVKAVYFLYIGALSAVRPFIPVYMYELGLSPFQLGSIRSLGPIVIFLTSVFWGSLADKFSKHRCLLLIGLLGTGLVYPLALLVPPVGRMCKNQSIDSNVDDYKNILMRNNRDVYEDTFQNNSWFYEKIIGLQVKRDDEVLKVSPNTDLQENISLSEEGYPIYNILASELHAEHQLDDPRTFTNDSLLPSNETADLFVSCSGSTFGAMLIILVIAYTFVAATLVLLDSNTAEMCNYYPGASFGQQRCFGAVATIIFSLISGLAMDFYSMQVPPDPRLINPERPYHGEEFVPVFLLFFVLVICSFYPALKMAFPSHSPSRSISVSVLSLLKDFRVMCFFAITFVTGACKGITAAYLFVFLEELGATKTLMALCLSITCATQVPLMFHSNNFVDWLGYDTVFCIVLFWNGARFTLYSVMRNPWIVLPIGAVHGIFNGMYMPCCTVFANYIAPPGTSATLQAVLNATKGGLGEAFGILVSGLIYNQFGPVALFQGTAILSFVTLIVYTVSMYLCERNRALPGRGSERFVDE